MLHLSDLSIGDKAKIMRYSSGNPLYRKKLLIMGLTPGTQLQVTAIAPLGDPIQISLRGLSICLRKHEAHILSLEKIAS